MVSRRKMASFVTIVLIICLTFTVGLLTAGLFRSIRQDPYLSLFERLQPSFYLDAFFIILASSLLYTPLSYGVLNFAIRKAKGEAAYNDLFFLLVKPILLIKSVIMRVSIWALRGLYQLFALLVGVVLETMIILLYIACLKKNMLLLSFAETSQLIETIEQYSCFRWFSVLLWLSVVIILFISYLQFFLCKYALICFGELSVKEAICIGRASARGRLFLLCFRLLEKYTYYIILNRKFWIVEESIKKIQKAIFSFDVSSLGCSGARNLFFKKTKIPLTNKAKKYII